MRLKTDHLFNFLKFIQKIIIIFIIFLFCTNLSYSHDFHDVGQTKFEKKKNKNYLVKSHKKKNKPKKKKDRSKFWIANAYPNLKTSCEECKTLDGFVSPNTIKIEIYRMAGIIPGVPTNEDIEIQKKRGMIKTGLKPKFYNNAKCVTCDDCWAIDYSHKREWVALHKGRDLPMPFNTPVLSISDGTVVGIFENKENRKGIEIVLRHLPEQSGLPFYTYTQYTHFKKIPDLTIGQKIKIGEILGPNGNSGKKGNKERRPALHFSVFYSKSPNWSSFDRGFLVEDGYWMDPLAYLKTEPPYENIKVKKLQSKEILVGYKKKDGSIVPENTKKIWPFGCS